MIDENLRNQISLDVANGVNMEDSHIDYSDPAKSDMYAGLVKEQDQVPDGQVSFIPSNGVDGPADESLIAYYKERAAKKDAQTKTMQDAWSAARDAERLLEERFNADQPRDDHGRWTSGGGDSVATKAAGHASDLREPDGGFTLDPRTGESPAGTGDMKGDGPYAVATGSENASGPIPITDSMFEPDANGQTEMGQKIDDFIAANADKLSEPGMYLGGWHDPETGMVHLDVTEVLPKGSLDQAVALGSARNQIAITDLSTFKSIPTGGTGE